jgi:hypothetical protein
MPSKLSVYNAACLALGERKLSSLSENVVMRRRLDSAWDDDLVEYCLAQGLWNFAMVSARLDYSPSIEPDFGYRRAFDKPTDWVRTAIVTDDEYYRHHLTAYEDEADFWFCDIDTIYVQYVSSSTSYGFAKVTTGSESDAEKMERMERKMMIKARSSDAMDEPTQFPPKGTWLQARRANSAYDRER